MELRDLADEKRWLRFEETRRELAEQRRELAEQRRDEEMRRHEALEEKAAAVHARLDAMKGLVLRLIIWLFCVTVPVVVVVEAGWL